MLPTRTQIKDFAKDHKVLLICMGLYVLVFIVRFFYDPLIDYAYLEHLEEMSARLSWSGNSKAKTDALKQLYLDFPDYYFPKIPFENKIFQKFPTDFLCFGVSDMILISDRFDMSPDYFSIFFIVFVASELIQKKLGKTGFENVVIGYCLDNILLYFGCIVMRICYNSDKNVFQLVDSMFTGDNIAAIIISVIFIIAYAIFLFLPGTVNGFAMFVFIALIGSGQKFAYGLIQKLHLGHDFMGELITFLLVVLAVTAINFFVSFLANLVNKIIMKVMAKVGKTIAGIFRKIGNKLFRRRSS